MTTVPPRVVALSGGIGGAKLALGLSRMLPPGELLVVANTGDDFEHLGLTISPDIDTLMYTLAGLDDRERGWGRRDETWTFMAALAALGGETWFQLGDGDLATHVERTRRLAAGESLSAITADFCRRLGIATRIVPMSDDRVRTRLLTVRRLARFPGLLRAATLRAGGYRAALRRRAGRASASGGGRSLAGHRIARRDHLSLQPVHQHRADPGRSRHARGPEGCPAPVVAVSPIIGGRAIKGPTAKMMSELGLPATAAAVARRYGGLIDGYVLDHADAACAAELGISATIAHTLMLTLKDRDRLAREVLAAADRLSEARHARPR